jgi:DNA-binding HxlR family transcriptional regulator
MHLALLRLRSTPSDLHYLNRLVEDLGVDEQVLDRALRDLEQLKRVTRHVDKQRGTYFKLTPAGGEWRPKPGRQRTSPR